MKRFLLLTPVIYLCSLFTVFAQDYSNSGLVEIKEQTDAMRMDWNKVFDDAVASKNFSILPVARQSAEAYIDGQLSALRRLYAQGDGRGLLTSVTNYLQIQKQFVKDVMLAAEKVKPDDQVEIDKINQRISDFAQKEKIFLIEINNALATEPNDYVAPQSTAEVEEEEDDEPQEMRGSVVEERERPKRSGKLPHEKGKKNKRDNKEDESDE